MKKKILIKLRKVNLEKVKKTFKNLEKNYFLDYYVSDQKTSNLNKILYFLKRKNQNNYVCFIDFIKNKSLKDFFFYLILQNKILSIKPFLAPKARHNFRKKKDIKYFLENFNKIKIFLNYFVKKINSFVKHDVIFLAGTYKEKEISKDYKFKIYSHSFDFENFIIQKKLVNNEKKKHKKILFIDEMMQNHPDYIEQNLEVPISYSQYLTGINKLFKKINKCTGYNSEIAFHPKSDKNYMKDFDDVLKHFQNTYQAIYNADLVIAHASTAIGIATLFNKPIVLLIFEEMKDTWMEAYIQEFSKSLKCEIFYLNEFLSKIDKEFIDKLILTNTNNKDFIDKFLSHPKKQKNQSIEKSLTQFLRSLKDDKNKIY